MEIMARKGFLKYQKCDAVTTIPVKFGKLEPGNLFYLADYGDEMLLVCMNERKNREYDRNCVIIVAQDKGYCGLGMWLPDDEEVYVIEDTNVILRAYYLL